MVEIGAEAGALVVYTSPALLGEEIEMRTHGGAWAGVHTTVRARHVAGRVLYAGVFGSIPVGRYDLRRRGQEADATVHSVTVGPGAVVETRWPEPEI